MQTRKKIWTDQQKWKQKLQILNFYPLYSDQHRGVCDELLEMLGPINQWLLNISPEAAFLQKRWGCPFIPSSKPETRFLLPMAGGDADCGAAQGTGELGIQVPCQASLCLEHELHGSLGWHWLKRDAGLRKSSPTPKTGFLVKDPSHWPCHPEALVLLGNPVQGSPWPLLVPL